MSLYDVNKDTTAMTYGEVIIACFHLITGVCVRATEKSAYIVIYDNGESLRTQNARDLRSHNDYMYERYFEF